MDIILDDSTPSTVVPTRTTEDNLKLFEAAVKAGIIDGDTAKCMRDGWNKKDGYGGLHEIVDLVFQKAEEGERFRTSVANLLETGQVPKPELGQVRIQQKRVNDLRPSPENDKLYRPIDPEDPDIIGLARSIQKDGVLEPLVISVDDYIISGHRRLAAAKLAGLETVPCRIESVYHGQPDFVRLLREHNRQREKSNDEKLREVIVDFDPEREYAALIQHRAEKSEVVTPAIEIIGTKKRAKISKAKLPMMTAIQQILEDMRSYWPLTDRQIHYRLLKNPPLVHASKPKSTYANTRQCYQSTCDLLTRARLAKLIPMDAIDDETRPYTVWDAFPSISGFLDRELDGFLRGYYRDLMQSQPNHIEMVGEKNTLLNILKPVASQYCIPLAIGRGYASLPPRARMAARFRKSGKEKLIVILLSDFDPDGDEISHSFARSMRDDFGITQIHAVRAALTAEQVKRFDLPPEIKAKKTSVHFDKFTKKNGGDTVFELEALHPAQLQQVVREVINSVVDVEAFNREVEAEKKDSVYLAALRKRAKETLGKVA
jgi:hypothetical protein